MYSPVKTSSACTLYPGKSHIHASTHAHEMHLSDDELHIPEIFTS